jgi:hypothetical protein
VSVGLTAGYNPSSRSRGDYDKKLLEDADDDNINNPICKAFDLKSMSFSTLTRPIISKPPQTITRSVCVLKYTLMDITERS